MMMQRLSGAFFINLWGGSLYIFPGMLINERFAAVWILKKGTPNPKKAWDSWPSDGFNRFSSRRWSMSYWAEAVCFGSQLVARCYHVSVARNGNHGWRIQPKWRTFIFSSSSCLFCLVFSCRERLTDAWRIIVWNTTAARNGNHRRRIQPKWRTFIFSSSSCLFCLVFSCRERLTDAWRIIVWNTTAARNGNHRRRIQPKWRTFIFSSSSCLFCLVFSCRERLTDAWRIIVWNTTAARNENHRRRIQPKWRTFWYACLCSTNAEKGLNWLRMPCMRGWNHFAMPHASILHIIPWYTICSIYTPWYTMVDPMRVTAISTHRPGASAPFWGTRNGGEPKLSQWWRTFLAS